MAVPRDPESTEPAKTRVTGILLKAAVSASFIWWIVGWIDIGRLKITLAQLELSSLAYAIILVAMQTALMGWRWHRIVHILGGRLARRKAILWSFVGLFVSQVLPTSVGGDVVRVWSLHRHGTAPGLAFSSVAIERATGVALLGLMITLCLPAVWGDVDDRALRGALLGVGPGLLAALVIVGVADKVVAAWLPDRLAGLVTGLAGGLRQLARDPRAIVEISCLGITASLTGILAAYMVGRDLSIGLSFPAYVVFVGGAALFSVLPISIGGWGIREAGMVALFGMAGVPPERALVLSIVYGALPLLVSLPWGVTWWASGTFGRGNSMRHGPAPARAHLESGSEREEER